MRSPKTAAGYWHKGKTDTFEFVDDNADYLVQTNGSEWRDHDLFVWKGSLVRLRAKYTRGKPILIARIYR